jgi:site-specific recombinase XerC
MRKNWSACLTNQTLTTTAGFRDRAILELLFSSGLRVSELVGLDKDHINLKRREFMVRGKGQKDRPIFISTEAASWLQQYLDKRTDTTKPLFHEVWRPQNSRSKRQFSSAHRQKCPAARRALCLDGRHHQTRQPTHHAPLLCNKPPHERRRLTFCTGHARP